MDVGMAALATLSAGETVLGPKPHQVWLRCLNLRSRSLSRPQKAAQGERGGRPTCPFRKAQGCRDGSMRKRPELNSFGSGARLASIRHDALHKLTSELARRFPITCLGSRHMGLNAAVAGRRLPTGGFQRARLARIREPLLTRTCMRPGLFFLGDWRP